MPEPRPVPKHGNCFVCDPANPGGLRADLMLEDDRITCRFAFRGPQEGAPRHAHGGSLAALLDEMMGVAAWTVRRNMMAVHLQFDYRRPVPLGVELDVQAWVTGEGHRSVRVACEVRLPDGQLAVEGQGVFANAPEAIFSERPFYPGS